MNFTVHDNSNRGDIVINNKAVTHGLRGWGYSPLAEITPANVSRLQPVWTFATGQVEGHQAPPMVNNGVMFVATPGNQLLTIDARTGAVLWRYKTTDPRRHDAAPSDQPRRRPL